MTRIAIAGAAALLAGCVIHTHTGRYDPNAFSPTSIAREDRLEGRVLVLTAPEDDAYVFSDRPSGFVGWSTQLTLPLGLITREAAVRELGALFTGGAQASSDASQRGDHRAVVTPRLAAFTYDYAWSVPHLEVSVRVAVLDARGETAFERTYGSGRLKAGSFGASAIPPKRLEKMVHVAIQELLRRAAADVKAFVERGRPPPPGERPPEVAGQR